MEEPNPFKKGHLQNVAPIHSEQHKHGHNEKLRDIDDEEFTGSQEKK